VASRGPEPTSNSSVWRRSSWEEACH